jgi:glucose-specific phosphotransferase system IIA component
MAQKLNYEQMATDIVQLVGGAGNVQSLGHCMTRLRFVLKDEEKANAEKIKQINGVLGVVSSGGQFMIILGQNLLPVFESSQKILNLSAGQVDIEENNNAKKKDSLSVKSVFNNILGFVSASVTPLVVGLVAGGMLKVLLLLLTMVSADFSSTQTYTLLSGVADAPFYFMPIFVAYGAAIKLGGTPIYSMLCAAALLHTNYIGLVAAGEAVHLFGIPVKLVSYSSSLLPALLIAFVAYHVEKLMNKIIPGIFKSILVGLGTILITSILGYTILGPLGSYLGSYLALAFVFLGSHVSFIAVGILAACLPWLVMCGMHAAIAPFMVQAIADPGYDPLIRPAFILHNMAEGGACIGVGLRSQNAEKRSEAFSIAFGCIVAGVTEPAIYGINLPRKKPMFGVMAGGAAGGVVAGLLGARAYIMGYSTILALPIFKETVLAMLIAIIVDIVVAALVTFVLENDENIVEKGFSTVEDITAENDQFVAVADGNMIDLSTVNDETFAKKILGDGVAFELTGNIIAAPCSGTLSVLAETGHAFGIIRPDGVEVVVHVGINTVEMNGVGFTNLVNAGECVKAGQPIIEVDTEMLKNNGYDLTTMLIITNDNNKVIDFKPYGPFRRGEIISK